MASSTVRDAFRTRLQAQLPAWNYIETVNAGSADERPGSDANFVTLEFIGGRETPESVGAPGSNLHRERGVVLVRLFAVRGSGNSAIEAACDTVRAAFRSWRDSGSNLRTLGADPPLTLDDDGFYRAQIGVEYEFDTYG